MGNLNIVKDLNRPKSFLILGYLYIVWAATILVFNGKELIRLFYNGFLGGCGGLAFGGCESSYDQKLFFIYFLGIAFYSLIAVGFLKNKKWLFGTFLTMIIILGFLKLLFFQGQDFSHPFYITDTKDSYLIKYLLPNWRIIVSYFWPFLIHIPIFIYLLKRPGNT